MVRRIPGGRLFDLLFREIYLVRGELLPVPFLL